MNSNVNSNFLFQDAVFFVVKNWKFLYYKNVMRMTIYYCPWERENGPESHDLLRIAVGCYLGEPPAEFTVRTDAEHGKPYVAELPEVHFSITHAGGYWACAVGDCTVGLDLQEKRGRAAEAIAQRFFHPSEIAWIAEHGEDEFFRIWAAKESYVKFIGKGLSDGIDWFSVVDGVPACQREIPFLDGYWMVLTTEREADPCFEELPVIL